MPNKDYDNFIKIWTQRIAMARKEREEWKGSADKAVEWVEGVQWTVDEARAFGGEVSVANIISSTVEIMNATIYNRDPYVIVRPKKGEYEQAELIQALLMYWYRELGLKQTIKGFVSTALVMGQAFLKLGITKKAIKIDEDYYSDIIGDEVEKGFVTEGSYDTHRIFESLWVEEVDPRNIIFDPSSKKHDLSDARWIGEEIRIPLELILKDDEKFPKELKKDIEKNLSVKPDEDLSSYPIDAIEIYDKRRNEMFVIVEGHDRPIRVEKYNFGKYEQFPYERLVFRKIPFKQYPISDVTALVSLQRNLNKMLSIIVDHSLRQKNICLARGSVDDEEINRVARARNGDIVRVLDNNQYTNISMNPISGEVINALNQVIIMIREQSGLSDYLRGQRPEGVRSATEAAQISQGDMLRLGDRREILEVSLRNIARFMVKLMRTGFNGGQLVDIDPRASSWKSVSSKDLRGEFDIQIEHASISPIDRSIEANQANQVLQILSPYLESGIIQLRPMLSKILKSIEVDPNMFLLSEQEASENAQLKQAMEQIAQENQQLKAALGALQKEIQNGNLAETQGPAATAIPIEQLQKEADDMAKRMPEEQSEEENPLLQ